MPFEVYTYSSEAMLPEQIASLRSLLRYAGRPSRITIVSDGSHPSRSLDLLRRLDPSVVVMRAAELPLVDVPSRLQDYLTRHPTGKQMSLIMSLPARGPALYLDADVLFFPGGRDLTAELERSPGPAAYLLDCQLSADERMLRDPSEHANPVNTGFLFLREPLDWTLSVARLMELSGEPSFFTNQTAAHLTMHANRAQPLDPAKFVVRLDDQFIYQDRHAASDLVLRHYVNPVRHKFWTSLWRQGAL
ncbi:MAG: hypothetical protein ABI992_00610 [Chthoniobacterales bacterium]